MKMNEQVLVLIVRNRPDVLARVAGIFSGRGFNIENISANVMPEPDITKITIVTRGDLATVEKIEKQLKKLVDVREVTHINGDESVKRELLLVRAALDGEDANEVLSLIEGTGGRIITRNPAFCIAEFTGSSDDINGLLNRLDGIRMEKLSRSGTVAL
jgi:acetolactate synthase-1/3 small subunit